jgi:signal transduction histidine kinase/HD-like signal output (HDOD) protein
MNSSLVDVNSLPVLPEVADAVIRMALDEDVSVRKIADLIEKDQALTARILSVSNSSFYKRSREIHTVRDAVVLIGAEAVRTLVLGISILSVFPSRRDSPLDHRGFWRHCLGCAMYAEALVGKVSQGLGPKAFCAGLLHDIGKLVLDLTMPDEYARVIEKAKDGLRRLDEIEREALGLTHAEVGREVMAHWRLPGIYEETVWCHHEPVMVLDDDQYLLAGIVNVADAMAHMTALGSSGNCFPPQVPAAVLGRFSLDEAVLDALMAEIPSRIDRICAEIGLGKGSQGLFSLVNQAGIRLAETALRLQQEGVRASAARRRSDALLELLKALNGAAKVMDALTRASSTLISTGLVRAFLAGMPVNGAALVYEHRLESRPQFVKLGRAEARALVLERNYASGMSLPSGLFVYLDPAEADLGDDHEFITSLITSIASALKRIQAENALGREKNLLRDALMASSRERQKVEELMELTRELMDASGVGLCLVETGGRVRIENPVAKRLRESLGMGGGGLRDGALKMGAGELAESIAERRPFRKVVEREGTSVRITTQPVSKSALVLVTLEDITGELEDQKRTLAYAKMSVVGSLAASMAHNMKSPIGAIHGFASIVREDMRQGKIKVLRGDAEDQDLPDMLGNIVAASENLLRIVNQLLGFTRKWESPVVEIGLDEFVNGAFLLVDAQARGSGVILVNEAEPATVRMKAEALEQVLVNLLMNAVTASPRGGRVVVRARPAENGIEVAVMDEGIGMDEEQARRVFDPLYSAWPMKTGLGLGLSLSRQIVESMGGRISVTSALAKGTTFTVWIPLGGEP